MATAERIGFGPFAPEQGARSAGAVLGAVVAFAAAGIAVLRPLLDRVDPGGSHRWSTTAALLLAAGGLVAALLGLYQTAVGGRRGRTLVKLALAVAASVGIGAFLYGAAADGSLRLDRFGAAFFDLELIRLVTIPIARAAWNAVRLALVSQMFAMLVGLVVATMRLSVRRLLRLPAVWYVDVVRAVPLIVLTSLLFGGLPKLGITLPDFTAAVFILTINAGAYVSEIFRAGIQALPRGQMDAARSLGMPHGTSMLFVIIPQAVRAVIPPLMSEFIALLKDTAIVLLGVGVSTDTWDLFNAGRAYSASTFSPTPLMVATIGYVIIIVPLARVVGWAERRLRAGLA